MQVDSPARHGRLLLSGALCWRDLRFERNGVTLGAIIFLMHEEVIQRVAELRHYLLFA